MDFTHSVATLHLKATTPADEGIHMLNPVELCQRFKTSINSEYPQGSIGITGNEAAERLQVNGKNILNVYGTEDVQDWSVDPAEPEDPLESAQVSNEIADIDVAVLASLPRPTLELLCIHLMSNIRVRQHEVEDYMDGAWKKRWTSWKAKQRRLQLKPDKPAIEGQVSKVVREQQWNEIPIEDVVVGDIVKIKSGDMVPADCILLQTDHSEPLELQMSSVCGVSKSLPHSTYSDANSHTESQNVVWFGTSVVCGSAIGLAIRTGSRTVVGKCLSLATQQHRLPPPVTMKFDPTATHMPIHFDSPHILLNNRMITPLLGTLTTILCDREAVITRNQTLVTHVVLGHQILAWGGKDPDFETTQDSSKTTAESILQQLGAEEHAAEKIRLADGKHPPRLYINTFRLRADDLPISSIVKSDILNRLAIAGILCASEPASNEPINKAVRQWACEFPFCDKVRSQYRMLSSCFFSHLNLYGSLHMYNDDKSDKTGLLLIHGVAHRVFDTSNNVLTHKGLVPMSTYQRDQFQKMKHTINCPQDMMYGFAMMEVDLNRSKYGDEKDSFWGKDVMELFKNAEGLCYLGTVVTKEEGRSRVHAGVQRAHELGIKVIVCTSDTRPALETSLVETNAFQHSKEQSVVLEGEKGEHALDQAFWEEHYHSSDVLLASCSASMKCTAIQSLQAFDPSGTVLMVGCNAFSLPAMNLAHISVGVPLDSDSDASSVLVDDVCLEDFVSKSADLVLKDGSLLTLLQCVELSRKRLDETGGDTPS